MSGVALGSDQPKLSRPAVVSLGVCVMMLSVVVLPTLVVVIPAVCMWWLADDLARNPDQRPALLGWVALAIFTAFAVAGVVIATIFDSHFDCGGTLGGFGEAADARLDQRCADARTWRSVVGASLALMLCAAGVVAVRRSTSSSPPRSVAIRTLAILVVSIVALTALLVVT